MSNLTSIYRLYYSPSAAIRYPSNTPVLYLLLLSCPISSNNLHPGLPLILHLHPLNRCSITLLHPFPRRLLSLLRFLNPIRPIKPNLQHRARPILHALHRLFQKLGQSLRAICTPSPDLISRSRARDPRVVRRRRERDIEVFVGRFATLTIWMDEEEGFAGGVPS